MFLIIIVVFAILGWFVQNRLKSRFKKYSKVPIQNGLTGKDIAEMMLKDHGIYDVQVVSVAGRLTDHYNPTNKTINLSEAVYHTNSVAAAAVAAHETGHAVQHATAYSMLQMRSKMVPVVNISSKMINWIFMIGLIGSIALGFGWQFILPIIIVCYAVITLFSLVTLPVEFDASNRALRWLQGKTLLTDSQQMQAENALKWAASTYIVSALASVSMLLYYIYSFMGND